MKKLIASLAVAIVASAFCHAQGVNQQSYTTNSVVSVSSTTPTLISAQKGGINSMSITFATNTTAGVGVRFLAVRPDLTVASQTNAFAAGTIYGNYINPAGKVGSIVVPAWWSYDSTACPVTAIYGLADSSTATLNVTVSTTAKP